MSLYSNRTYDNALLLRAASLLASTATESTILDMGSGLADMDMIVDVSAIEVDTGDESYAIILEGSPDATFGTAGNISALARLTLGHHSATAVAPQGFESAVGRYLVPVRNEQNGTLYRYLRIRTVIAGTIATGINFSVWLAKDE